MRETQGKVEASKDTVKELNNQLEPVEVITALDYVPIMFTSNEGTRILTAGVSWILSQIVCHTRGCSDLVKVHIQE